MYRYFLVYKPFKMLSQFTPENDYTALGDLADFPGDVYPVGRLDADSEGLLLLTNDKKLNEQLLNPEHGHERTYLVQVEGEIDDGSISTLQKGVVINMAGYPHVTHPCKVRRIGEPNHLPDRDPPIRFRASIPTSWIEIKLTEGKNRQVRKMTAKVGFPTLRLVRDSIELLDMEDMFSGKVEELSREEVYYKLRLGKFRNVR